MFSPITTKEVQSGAFQNVIYAVSNMQGWRSTQEDTHIIKKLFPANALGMFGVFDGHGGTYSSHYLKDNFVNIVNEILTNKTTPPGKDFMSGLLVEAFLETDRQIFDTAKTVKHVGSGTTACVCIYGQEKFYTAWAGDSRVILCRHGKAIPMTVDHKPALETERRRIRNCGGMVMNNRVQGILAVSRALGDFNFKDSSKPAEEYVVSGTPEIFEIDRDEDEFLLLACDGIWDVMSNQQACTFVRKRLQQMARMKGLTVDMKLGMVERIASQVLDECLRLGSRDNMTCAIVVFETSKSLLRKPSPVSMACSVL
jgi:serine/threonine protein phosphatase PrpC